jgi:2-polyprenyl-3-methyl-5-hydroxy-6-metoxy-1,4-benzoquinol methylase
MRLFHARELDEFVAQCDSLGGIAHPNAEACLNEFSLKFDTKIDQRLDPFSEAYFQAQVRLYSELSGRELDQETGELTPFDVDLHSQASNPYNSRDVRFLSKHVRTVITALMIADLPPGGSVLDAGSGWGLSSEAMAFCGATVTSIDINPRFVELVRRRSERLSLPIEAVHSEFDRFDCSQQFDLLLFYECLHHSLKPWETLAHLGKFVKPDGKILFAGEPGNWPVWRHWGLRLDGLSVYCIRKFGWWESGWTTEFITRCFARAGFALNVYSHIGLNNGPIGVATHAAAVPKPHIDLSVMTPIKAWRIPGPVRRICKALGIKRPKKRAA